MNERKADFILKGEEVIYPEIPKDGLELYYDIKGKTNQDLKKNEILDMSGKGRHAALTGFAYSGRSGYYDGLVFDEIDDTLVRPAIAGLDPNNLTYQVNGNIVRFKPDGTSQMVKDGEVVEIGRNLFKNSNYSTKNAGASIGLIYWAGNIQTGLYDLDVPLRQSGLSEKRICTTSGTGGSCHDEDSFTLVEGETYTLSYWAKGAQEITHNAYFVCLNRGADNYYITTISPALTTEWKKYSYTFTVLVGQGGIYRRRSIIYTVSTSWISHFKLEKGSIATPWTPAPEDLIANLSCKNNILGDLENVIDDMDLDTKTGESVTFEGYKDNHIDVTVEGNTVQSSDWYAKDGLSTQYQDTKVMGKNIIPTEFYQWESGHYSMTDGTKVGYPSRIRLKDLLKVTPGSSLYFDTFNSPYNLLIRGYDANKLFVSNNGIMANGSTYVIPANVYYIGVIYYQMGDADTYDSYLAINNAGNFKPFICLSSQSNKTYEPYKDIIKNGLVMELSGRNFFNSPQTTSLKDRSGNGNHGTPSGFSYTTASGSDGNGGIVFDGVDDYIQIPIQSTILSDFTAEWNVKINSLAGNSQSTYLLNTNQSGLIASNPIIYISSGTFNYWAGSNNYGTISIQTGVDYHLCAIRSGNSVTLKVNNIVALTYTDNSTSVATNKFYISGTGNPQRLNGTLKSFRFYNRALSDSEIYQNYMAGVNLNVPAPTDPSPVVSNLPAGTYKYTSIDGIYEFTLTEDLRGLGVNVDKVVFDRVSKQGKLERKVGFKAFDGTESWWAKELYNFYINVPANLGGNYNCDNIVSSHFKNSLSSNNDTVGTLRGGAYYSSTGTYNGNLMFNYNGNITETIVNWKMWLSNQSSIGNPLTIVYELKTPATTPLTFTKVASSTKAEVPMTFFTATPSLEYPAQVWDVGGKVVSRNRNMFSSIDLVDELQSNGLITKSGLLLDGRDGFYATNIAYYELYSNYLRNEFKQNTSYTLSFKGVLSSWTDSRAGFSIGFFYTDSTSQTIQVTPTQQNFTMISNPNKTIKYIRIGGWAYNGRAEIWDIMLTEGSTQIPYEPNMRIKTTLPTLRKIGTVADTYNPSTGVLTKRISDWVTLDGKTWIVNFNRLGYHQLYSTTPMDTPNFMMIKYDSKILTNLHSYTTNEEGSFCADNKPYVNVYEQDSGWGENINPIAPEIKAYFYGWKMCNSDGTSPYYKSEVPYTPSTWAEWSKDVGITVNNSAVTIPCDSNDSIVLSKHNTSFKPSTKYGILYNVVSSTMTTDSFYVSSSGDALNGKKGTRTIGNNKVIATSASTIDSNSLHVFTYKAPTGESITIKDIRVFELPSGSQIETDFNTLTADKLATKYTFNGLCVKNWKKVTDGTGQTSTLPTASYTGYTPYKMIYQLATPVTTYLAPNLVPTYYPTTVIETDSPSYCKPAITAKIKAIDYLKERRTINNMLLWSRALSDPEILKQYRLFHERYRMKSATVNGVPIEGFVWIEGGANIGTTMSTDMTIYI